MAMHRSHCRDAHRICLNKVKMISIVLRVRGARPPKCDPSENEIESDIHAHIVNE